MKTRQIGFSLLELLVGIVISLVGIVAVMQVYVDTRQTQRTQAFQSKLSEDGRFALAMMRRIISQAGFRPNPTVLLATDRFSIVNNVATVKFVADGSNQVGCSGSVLAANSNQTIVIQRSGSKLQCDLVDWIAPATAGQGAGSEIVDLLFFYGLDTGPANTPTNFGCGLEVGSVKPRDCIVDSFSTSLGGAAADQIVAVRVCFVLRTELSDASLINAGVYKNCSGNDIAGSASDGKLYRMFVSTVLLRNR